METNITKQTNKTNKDYRAKKEITDGETIITLFFIAILIVIFIGQPISEHFKVVKECKQAVSYYPAKGAYREGTVFNIPAEDAYFSYRLFTKFESREAAEKDCVSYRKKQND